MKTIQISKGKKIYFTSDHHFGAPTKAASKLREEKFVAWLDDIKKDAEVLFILGTRFLTRLFGLLFDLKKPALWQGWARSSPSSNKNKL